MYKILVAEDDKDIRNILKDSLEEEFEDVVVEVAVDGRQALEMASRNEYVVIASDIKMPHLSGIEFLRKLREQQNYTPFLIITGHGDLPHAVEALRMGAIDFINKPFDMNRVFESVSIGMNLGSRIINFNNAIDELKEKGELSPEEIDRLQKLNMYMANLNNKKVG
ncbi:MAG: response regulator [Bdellovibrionales bacterium]